MGSNPYDAEDQGGDLKEDEKEDNEGSQVVGYLLDHGDEMSHGVKHSHKEEGLHHYNKCQANQKNDANNLVRVLHGVDDLFIYDLSVEPDVNEASPDVSLIGPVPFLTEVFLWALFLELGQIVYSRVDKADS